MSKRSRCHHQNKQRHAVIVEETTKISRRRWSPYTSLYGHPTANPWKQRNQSFFRLAPVGDQLGSEYHCNLQDVAAPKYFKTDLAVYWKCVSNCSDLSVIFATVLMRPSTFWTYMSAFARTAGSFNSDIYILWDSTKLIISRISLAWIGQSWEIDGRAHLIFVPR